MSNIDDFKARLTGGGARANLFRALINFPAFAGGNSEKTSFMCKAAQLPASVIAPIEVAFRGRKVKVAGDRTFENWTATIINDGAFEVRNSFERWMNAINEHQNNLGILNPTEYKADLAVEQLNRQNQVVKTYNIQGAFPVNVSSIEVNWETNDAIEEFTVEFAYDIWTANTTS